MNWKKRTIFILVAMLMLGSFTACGGNDQAEGDGGESRPERQFVTIVTGGTGGTYYPVGTILATLWNEELGHLGVNASAQSSGGSVENLNMLKDGEAHLGIAMANLTLFAYEGQQRFQDNQFEGVRFVTALWPDVTQFVVTESSGIETLSDIAGNSFNVGSAGSGTEYSSNIILEEVAGLSLDDVHVEHLGYTEASSAMQDGQLDGMNAEGGIPTSAVSEIFASRTAVRMLEFSDEDYQTLHAVAPYYGQFTVPGGMYTGLDEDVQTVGVKSALIASEDLDADLVYEMLVAMYDHLEEIQEAHEALRSVTLEESVKGLAPVPFHDGAIRFYEERGIEIPEDMRP
ncbi:hypothetical protein SAMN05192551_101610 [Tindallia magadiensis]|uniref:TRAP transporter solute receptor, TAXI family n=1 Tax=Tindallia magadiensis TaxID=69895 RepID=A0A1I3B5Y2_9FIRM|nr:TAXI family TRAP transporter solute-binding subunit [Tindallia magadiensis]SFH57715.1 hypothetical protein SAMN05192551_101610 [Tindallia magadiensis]